MGWTAHFARLLPLFIATLSAFVVGYVRMRNIGTTFIVAVKFGFLFSTGVLAILCVALAIFAKPRWRSLPNGVDVSRSDRRDVHV